MSFNLSFNARSRSHALALLEERKSHVPAAAHLFLRVAIENIGPQSGQELRAVSVVASGHLAESSSEYSVSSGDLRVTPLFAPD